MQNIEESIFLKVFAEITDNLSFNMLVYDIAASKMYNLHKGRFNDHSIPDAIEPLLHDSDMYCAYFSNKEKVIILYFIRLHLDGGDYVIVIQDDNDHKHINSFVSELIKNIMGRKGDIVLSSYGNQTVEDDIIADFIKAAENLEISEEKDSEDSSFGSRQEMQLQIADLENKLASLSDELSRKFSLELDSLNEKIKQLETESIEKDMKIDEKERKLIDIESTHKDLQDMLSDSETEKANLRSKIEELMLNMPESQAEDNSYDEMLVRIEELKAELEEAKTAISDKDSKILSLNEQIESFKKAENETVSIDEFEDKVAALEDGNLKLQSMLDEKGSVLEHALESLADKENDNIIALSLKIDKLISNIEAVFADRKVADEIEKNISSKIDELSAAISAISVNREYQAETSVKIDAASSSSLYNESSEDIESMKVTIESLNTRNKELSSSLKILENKLNDYKKKLSVSEMDKDSYINELKSLKNRCSDIFRERKELIDKNNKMLKIVEIMSSDDKAKELIDLKNSQKQYQSKLARYEDMIKNYQIQLDKQMMNYKKLNSRTFLQLERLLNTARSKSQLDSDELMAIFTFLNKEINGVKKNFMDIDRANFKDLDNPIKNKIPKLSEYNILPEEERLKREARESIVDNDIMSQAEASLVARKTKKRSNKRRINGN